MCVILVILSVMGLFSDFITHMLDSIDGLLLLAVCLMMTGLFSLLIFFCLKGAGWLPHRSNAGGEEQTAQGK